MHVANSVLHSHPSTIEVETKMDEVSGSIPESPRTFYCTRRVLFLLFWTTYVDQELHSPKNICCMSRIVSYLFLLSSDIHYAISILSSINNITQKTEEVSSSDFFIFSFLFYF